MGIDQVKYLSSRLLWLVETKKESLSLIWKDMTNTLQNKIVTAITIGAILLIGPILQNIIMAEQGFLGLPKSYVFILLVWFIFMCYIFYLTTRRNVE